MKIVNVLELLHQSQSGEFKQVLPFNNTALGAVDIQGVSPIWEMHPDTDELFYILQGELSLELLTETSREYYSAKANEAMVIPKGLWHKFSATNGAKFIYLTPGQSLHCDKDDPRD